MNTSAKDRFRTTVRLCIGICLVPLGALTIFLFAATGRLIERSFTSWEELGCIGLGSRVEDDPSLGSSPTRFFCGFSPCGRYYATVEQDLNKLGTYDFVICDIASKKPLGSSLETNEPALAFWISSEGRLLVVNCRNSALVYRWPSMEFVSSVQPDEGGFALPDERAIWAGGEHGDIWTSRIGPVAKSLPFRIQNGSDLEEYHFDPSNRPKAFVNRAGFAELWDMSTNTRDWQSSEAILENKDKKGGDSSLRADLKAARTLLSFSPDATTFCTYHYPSPYSVDGVDDGGDRNAEFRIYSLENAALRSVHRPTLTAYGTPIYSPDSRYLFNIYSHRRLAWASSWLPDPVKEWLGIRFKLSSVWEAIDLQTGRIYPKMPGLFQAWASRPDLADPTKHSMLLATEDGWHEFDVPFRSQWFTPWAWAAGVAWLTLAAAWWRLRRKPIRAAIIRP